MQTNYANLFSTQPLDRLEEIYLKTMDEMDDETLQAFCSTAKYNKNLCNDNFWLRRIKENNLELLLPYRSHYDSLQSFYFNVRKDACYIIAAIGQGEEDAYAFNDIARAIRTFANLVNEQYEMGYDIDADDYKQDIELNYPQLTSMYEIYVLFNNVVLTEQSILSYSIFNLRKDSTNYLNPNITNFPLLSHDYEVLYYVKRKTGTNFISEIAILPYDSEHLRLLPINAHMIHLLTDSVTYYEFPAIWYKGSFAIIYSDNDEYVNMLIDTSLLTDSAKNLNTQGQRYIGINFNSFNGAYVSVEVDIHNYRFIRNMFTISERVYKAGESLEVISPSIIIEALLDIGSPQVITKRINDRY